MSNCAKPADNGKFINAQIYKPRYDEIRNLGGPKNRSAGVSTNLRVIEDSLSIFSWFLLTGQLDKEAKEHIQEWAGAPDIKGQDLEGDHKTWFKAFRAVNQDLHEFVKSRIP